MIMDTNTALRAEETKAMIFISEAHEKFYYEKLKEKLLKMDGRGIR